MKTVSTAGGHAYVLASKLNLYMNHLASYPKVIYLPMVLFACGAYGYHSVKKSTEPNLSEITRTSGATTDDGEQVAENPFTDYQSFKKWVKSGVKSIITEIVACSDVKK